MREKKKVTNIVSFDIGIILNKDKLCMSWVRYIYIYVKMQSKISSIQSIEEDYFFLYNPASTDTASEFSIYLLCLSNNRNMKIQKKCQQQKSARF